MLCPYCGQDKDLDELTDEHVLPQALGGALTPANPFKIKACRACNNACGRHVDGPFCRSLLIHYARRSAGSMAVDMAADPIVPLGCMGSIKAWTGPDVCDLWIGPTGDSIYHFHDAYDGGRSIVGRPIVAKNADPGVVFAGVRATNPVWHPIIARSIKAEFPKAPVYYINGVNEGVGPPYPPVPNALAYKYEWAASLNGQQTPCSVELDPNCGDRFVAKVALGMGSLVLGRAFDTSEYASKLRQFLWTREPDAREGLGVYGTAFSLVGKNKDMEELLSWRNCHTIMLMPAAGRLTLGINLYGSHGMAVVISFDDAMWRGRVSDLGMVWVVCPGLRRYAGPMDFLDFYEDAKKVSPTGPLMELGARIDATPPLPPVHLPTSFE